MTRNETIEATFVERYGYTPSIRVRAPGRLELMGSHTDYNEGDVLAVAIDSDLRIFADPREDRFVRIHSMNLEDTVVFSLDDLSPEKHEGNWARYVCGVAAMLHENGVPLKGMDAVCHSTIPIGGGMSSSAALTCAVAVVFEQLAEVSLDRGELAGLCREAERVFAGVPCGILDPYLSLMGRQGHAVLLNCRRCHHESVPIPTGLSFVVCDSGVKRQLRHSAYDDRRRECEEATMRLKEANPGIETLRDVDMAMIEALEPDWPESLRKRAHFIVEEHKRVSLLAHAFRESDLNAIDAVMQASYDGARDLFEICLPEMNRLRDVMQSGPGVHGVRQTGAGFGGCLVACVEKNQVRSFAEYVRKNSEGSALGTRQVHEVHTGQGAGIMVEGE